MDGIARWIDARATITPDRPALIGAAGRRTYRAMAADIARAARALSARAGIGPGDRVAILSGNSIAYLECLFAVARLGAIAVPLNIRLADEELAFQLADSGAALLIADAEHLARADRLHQLGGPVVLTPDALAASGEAAADRPLPAEPDAAVPFLICYTSGTTGRPKGAVLTQENIFWNAVNNTLALELTSADRMLTVLPLFHIGGINCFALPVLFAGGVVVVPPRFDPALTLELIASERATIVMGVPTILDDLRRHPSFATADLSSVRWFYSGGAPCPRELIDDYLARGLPFGQGYGMTETAPTVLMLARDDMRERAGSVGKPVAFARIRVVDERGAEVPPGEVGELQVRGPNLFAGYWQQSAATAASFSDGWFRTGDLAWRDAAGFVTIAGRKHEMIISGGENIYPLEVEQVLATHPAVAEVVVFRVADERWGEVPAAVVARKPGRAVDVAELQAYCAGRLARYKIPRRITFVPALPRNATGKIDKRALARELDPARPTQ